MVNMVNFCKYFEINYSYLPSIYNRHHKKKDDLDKGNYRPVNVLPHPKVL